jgi:pimeloyl-ACP methyl ester carboxylesterase
LLVERLPWESDPPLDELKGAAFPILVISGNHHPAFNATCERLAKELSATLINVEGMGHLIPHTGEPFTEALSTFIDSA